MGLAFSYLSSQRTHPWELYDLAVFHVHKGQAVRCDGVGRAEVRCGVGREGESLLGSREASEINTTVRGQRSPLGCRYDYVGVSTIIRPGEESLVLLMSFDTSRHHDALKAWSVYGPQPALRQRYNHNLSL